MTTSACMSPIAGPNLDRVETLGTGKPYPEYTPGVVQLFAGNVLGRYVQFGVTVAAGANTTLTVSAANVVTATTGGDFSTDSGFPGAVSGQYGWVQRPATS